LVSGTEPYDEMGAGFIPRNRIARWIVVSRVMSIPTVFGRRAAVRSELESSRELLYRMAYAWCRDAALADDLAHEAAEKALRRAGQLRDAQRLRGWLLRILANCVRDHARLRREHVELGTVDELIAADAPTPEEAHASAQLALRVRRAVGDLPLGHRQVVTLVDLEGCSYAEVGEILEIPIGTVMSRLCRARQALRERLRPFASEALGTRLRSVK
jgi:RNA polymerase sigma-70 factor (ECF subfamily)